MIKKSKYLIGAFIFILICTFYSNKVFAFAGPTKSSTNFDNISKLIADDKQQLINNIISKENINLKPNRVISNEKTSSNSKIIKNPDINFTLAIDIQDLAITAKKYNAKNTDSSFDSRVDLNEDGIIDLYDLVLQSKHLGSSLNLTDLNLETYVGDMFKLPQNLEVTMTDGYLTNVKTSWTTTSVDTATEKNVQFTGQITDYKKSICANVKVIKRTENFNSLNYGVAAAYNDKIYYSNPANNLILSRSNLDGSYVVKICEDSAFYINVLSDWIYYVNPSDNNSIYKIKIDGTGRTKISNDSVEFMNISDGWIYYSNASDNYTIYKVKIDGSQRTKLNDLSSLYMYIYNDEIYFCDYSTYADGVVYGNLCSIKKDGTGYKDITYLQTGKSVIIQDKVFFLDYTGWLNCIPLESPGYQYSINGANGSYSGINTDGKYLYVSTDSNIYKYDPVEDIFPKSQSSSGGRGINICKNSIFAVTKDLNVYMTQTSLGTMSSKVFGIDSIVKKLYDSTDKVYRYDNYAYPSKIPSQRLDDSIILTNVSWDNRVVNSSNFESFSITGTVPNFTSKASLKVDVVDRGALNQNLDPSKNFNQREDWSYFTSPYDNKLYKIKNDGSERTKLSDDPARCINIVEDYIYYINDDDYIYKIKTDGTSRTKLYAQSYYNTIIVAGNKIYLQKSDGIYSINLDGSNPKKVVEVAPNTFIGGSMALVGNDIIYSDRGINAVSLDGTSKVCLYPNYDNISFITDGRYIFWHSEGNTISRLDMETNEVKILNIDVSGGLGVVFNGKLYYTNKSGTYKCDINGLNNKKILDIPLSIYLTPTGLVLQDRDNEKKLYKCGFDGENFTEFGMETQLKHIPPQTIFLTPGSRYTLPKNVMALMADNSTKEIQVTWNTTILNTSVVGSYNYEGKLEGYAEKATLTIIVSPAEVYGNESSNKSNNSIVAKYNDWIVYSNTADGSSLYKMKASGTSKTKLNNIPSKNINVYGDWIYYTTSNTIRRVRIDGTYDTLVKPGKLVTFKDGWIYYEYDNKFIKARVDGCEKKELLSNVINIITDESKIYYNSSDYDDKLYTADFNGLNSRLVINLSGLKYNFSGDYIYFLGYYSYGTYSEWATLKIKKDGTGLTKIMEHISYLLVTKNILYTVDSGELYKSDLNGNNKVKIASNIYSDINIIDDWIYYYDDTSNYRIKIDGTKKESF